MPQPQMAIVPAYGRVGENDVVKPRSPERNPRENARSSMTVDQRPQRFLVQWLLGAFRISHFAFSAQRFGSDWSAKPTNSRVIMVRSARQYIPDR
jgi:hypothetical protein